jgi:hypothetical protein
MTTHFITFGAGSINYIEAVSRLCTQATKIGLFDKITFFTEEDLQRDDAFWNRHSEFMMNNHRGYGYWLWKPYIIKKTIESLKDGDILLYLDSGCEINIAKKEEMLKYFDLVKSEFIITSFYCANKQWTKMDLILHLNATEYMDAPMRQGGALLFYVCDKTRTIINEWYDTACNYHLLDDSPSYSQNHNEYVEHRHDQSIFSLLTSKHNIHNTYKIESIVEYFRNRSGQAFY